MRPFSLYIHIPYCLRKCPYCDFNTYALNAIPEKEYTAGLLAEIDYRTTQTEWKGREIQSIYFGGGTPSLFSGSAIRRIIAEAGALFPISPKAEISLEANPGSIDSDKLSLYADAGINRVSFGAQSLQRDILKTLGRLHSPEDIEAAVSAAHAAGIHNINIDLMYGVPGQTLELLRHDIHGYFDLKPTHISAYGLTIEKGTPFYQSYQRGVFKLPSEDTLAEMMEELNSALPEAGYKHYEISNFAKQGFEAKHNLAYWEGSDYLGLGAGAHSCLIHRDHERRIGAYRWSNFALPNKYIQQAVSHGEASSWSDSLTTEALIFEFFFLGLRKINGILLSEFEEFFGVSAHQVYPAVIEALLDNQLLIAENDSLRLSDKGILLADSVIESFATPETALPKRPTSTAVGA